MLVFHCQMLLILISIITSIAISHGGDHMLIINTETRQMRTLHHGQAPDGWIPVPVSLEPCARAYCPYCKLVIEDGALVDITPTARPPEPEPEPTQEEQLRADVDFIAAMTGVEL
nr:MAG TPA: hypothetical protein [Caudoviricetes sp.]